MNPHKFKENILFWITGSLTVVLVLVAFSVFSPIHQISPEDISPSAGSSIYVDDEHIINNKSTKEYPNP